MAARPSTGEQSGGSKDESGPNSSSDEWMPDFGSLGDFDIDWGYESSDDERGAGSKRQGSRPKCTVCGVKRSLKSSNGVSLCAPCNKRAFKAGEPFIPCARKEHSDAAPHPGCRSIRGVAVCMRQGGGEVKEPCQDCRLPRTAGVFIRIGEGQHIRLCRSCNVARFRRWQVYQSDAPWQPCVGHGRPGAAMRSDTVCGQHTCQPCLGKRTHRCEGDGCRFTTTFRDEVIGMWLCSYCARPYFTRDGRRK
jgi:hypothetical protein